MKSTSTKVLTSKDGSTTPVAVGDRLDREAAEIRVLWQRYGSQHVASQLRDRNWIKCHKSLLLNLVMDDYVLESKGINASLPLEDYCQRFVGLGDSLERSIYRQLEVRKYLDQHPELLDLESSFDWPIPGETFHIFSILEELGTGALAKVYLCRQMNLAERLVVVKIALGSKVHEADLLGRLRHPHIMPVLWADYDANADASYLCMPFLGRSTLVDLIGVAFRNGPPQRANVILEAANLWTGPHDMEGPADHTEPSVSSRSSYVTEVLKMTTDLADGLAWAHQTNVIHGDIKSSNVLLTPGGSALLFDFNLGRDHLRTDGPAGGTLQYMAPEQLRCLVDDDPHLFPPPDTKTDIYSFGVLLCELFTGRPPIEPTSGANDLLSMARFLHEKQQAARIDVGAINPAVRGEIARLIHDCLAFDPALRPSSIAEVRDRLMRQLRVSAHGWRFLRAKPWRNSAIGGVLAASVLFGAALYASRPSQTERLFSQAMAARDAGEWKEGIQLFGEVLARDPEFRGARIERARCHVALEDFVSARTDCLQLIREYNDPEAMALFAYCGSLMGELELAQIWYRKAMSNGLTTPGILNNLGVSLLVGQGTTPLRDRLIESKALLLQALAPEPDSTVIRMNVIRMANLELAQGSSASVDLATENIKWLCRKHPENAEVWLTAFLTYDTLAQRDLATFDEALIYLCRAAELGAGPPLEQLRTGLKYSVYRELPDFKKIPTSQAQQSQRAKDRQTIGRFLDPLASADALGK
jgi:serine/threonine protein kinase